MKEGKGSFNILNISELLMYKVRTVIIVLFEKSKLHKIGFFFYKN